MSLIIDRVVILVEDVTPNQHEDFMSRIDWHEEQGKIPKTARWIGKKKQDYHYNLTIGKDEGGIFIGWQHNTCQVSPSPNIGYRLKLEFNPSKVSPKARIFDILRAVFRYHEKLLSLLDFALDIPIHKDSIIVAPSTGREENRIKGSRYWGERGTNGSLKIYDKKKEREKKGYEVSEPLLSRIEYTWKHEEGLPLSMLKNAKINPSSFYSVHVLDKRGGDNKAKPEIMSCIYAMQEGHYQLKDFSRTNQKHIKNALEGFRGVDLDSAIQEHLSDILDQITQYIMIPNEEEYLIQTKRALAMS